jgi:glycine oxidase
VVIGGGVIGASIAWELVQKLSLNPHQKESVTVIDLPLPGNASWAGAGILPATGSEAQPAHPYDQLRRLSHHLHPQWSSLLLRLTGIHIGYRQCGGLYLARTPAESAALAASSIEWEHHRVNFEHLDRDELLSKEPRLDVSRIRDAYWLPEEAQIRPPDHLRALRAACQKAGVHWMELPQNSPAEEIRGLEALVHSANRNCRAICICTGAWSDHWFHRFDVPSAIYPLRGQMVLYRCADSPLQSIVSEGHRYLVPRNDGRVLVGSSEEEVGFHTGTTPDVIDSLKQWGQSLVPELSHALVEKTWSGFRPASIDGFPYLGKLSGDAPIYMATGHGRHGLHLSCATARCMVECMLGQPTSIDLEPFGLNRTLCYP